MDTYYDEYGTPLKYHKFLKYFGLPLNILMTFGSFLNAISYISEAGIFALMDLAFYGIELVLLGMALYGFFTWKPCGFYGMLSHLVLSVVYAFIAVLLYAGLAPEALGTQIGSLIGSLIAGVLIGIYYLKRRPLFLAHVRSAYIYERIQQSRPADYEGVVHLDDRSGGDPTVCRVCGGKLNAGSNACMRCGTAAPVRTPKQTPVENIPPQAPSPEGETAPVAAARFCYKCGNKLTENSRFCSQCGTKLP